MPHKNKIMRLISEVYVSTPEIEGSTLVSEMNNLKIGDFCKNCNTRFQDCECECHYDGYDSWYYQDYDPDDCGCCKQVADCPCQSYYRGSRLLIYPNKELTSNYHLVFEDFRDGRHPNDFDTFSNSIISIDIELGDRKAKINYADIRDESLYDFINKFQDAFDSIKKRPILKLAKLEDIKPYAQDFLRDIMRMTNNSNYRIVSSIFQILIHNQCTFMKDEISERLEIDAKKTNPHLKRK